MFKNLLNKFVVWLFELLEQERNKRISADLTARLEKHDAEQRRLSDFILAQIEKKRDNCSHRKGAGGVLSGPVTDYNVAQHTFLDGSVRTWCLRCGRRFTGADAIRVMDNSTNTHTSSEQVTRIEDREQPESVPVRYGRLNSVQQNFMDAPLSPYISPSLWDRMTTKLVQLTKKKKLTKK